ncbi:MAG: MarP family serine protease [Actinobacteria bacterium]|nr:MarP family serine protease [Actinomycetota bacterium]
MNIVDAIVLASIVVFAWTGWRQGFVAGLLSFGGFLIAALAAALLLPRVLEGMELPGALGALMLATGILLAALVGQTVASVLGRKLRSAMTSRGVQVVDSAAGAVLNVAALAVVLWIIATAVGLVPTLSVAREVRSSLMLRTLDAAVPDRARDLFSGLRNAVDASGLPRVFSGLGQYAGPQVPAPNERLLRDPAVRAAWPSLVKVTSLACDAVVTGSGFAYAPDRILTNAHVVAGSQSPSVRIPGDPESYAASVVVIDQRLDLAVLRVDGLPAPALIFANRPARTGDGAVVAGFPGGGDLQAGAARIRDRIDARGEDIYGRSGVVRDVYSFRGTVVPGNSGGPLLSPSGRVYGVVFAAGLGEEETGYAITAEQAAPIADRGVQALEPVDTGACR